MNIPPFPATGNNCAGAVAVQAARILHHHRDTIDQDDAVFLGAVARHGRVSAQSIERLGDIARQMKEGME